MHFFFFLTAKNLQSDVKLLCCSLSLFESWFIRYLQFLMGIRLMLIHTLQGRKLLQGCWIGNKGTCAFPSVTKYFCWLENVWYLSYCHALQNISLLVVQFSFISNMYKLCSASTLLLPLVHLQTLRPLRLKLVSRKAKIKIAPQIMFDLSTGKTLLVTFASILSSQFFEQYRHTILFLLNHYVTW